MFVDVVKGTTHRKSCWYGELSYSFCALKGEGRRPPPQQQRCGGPNEMEIRSNEAMKLMMINWGTEQCKFYAAEEVIGR